MFYNAQSQKEKDKYTKLLQIIGSLSKLSSGDDKTPYLYYRMAENIFCKSFGARNLSRSDISLDACKAQFGIGLKTFLYKNGQPIEKIAEFNKDRQHFVSNNPYDTIIKIAEFRNKRLQSTSAVCGIEIDKMLYHCVAKADGKFILHESKMNFINITDITKQSIKISDNVIKFTDGIEEYSFNISKSTLFQRFKINPIDEISVEIFDDPYKALEECFTSEVESAQISNPIIETIFLPLYSIYQGGYHVFAHSGLNQWNALGRPRNPNEVYVPIPIVIHHKFPDFFPNRDTSFTLHLPSGLTLCTKVCQANSKALMTDPNTALGEWLLRDVLGLKEHELLTYEKLEEVGIDSVEINKFEDGTYTIDVKKIGSFETFKHNFLESE